jgi:hypothetical protein
MERIHYLATVFWVALAKNEIAAAGACEQHVTQRKACSTHQATRAPIASPSVSAYFRNSAICFLIVDSAFMRLVSLSACSVDPAFLPIELEDLNK